MSENRGERVYSIRRALGPDPRTEMALREFAELLNERAGKVVFDASELSKIERGKRKLSIDAAVLIASVDPLNRGFTWLAISS